jgi:hypothetical protein
MMAKLRQRGKTIVAIHSRRGDFARLPLSPFAFTVTPQRWREWLSSVWGQLDEPVLYIASDEPQLMNAALAEFKPMTAGDLGVALPSHIAAHGFFIDHYVLSHADVVGISCSSFSFSACMLNRNARLFVRATGRYENYWETMDPWNAMPFPIFSKGRLRRTFREAFEVARSTLGWREALSAMLWYAPQEVLSMYLSRAMLAFFADGLRGPLLMTLANLFAWFDSSFERVDPRRPRGRHRADLGHDRGGARPQRGAEKNRTSAKGR